MKPQQRNAVLTTLEGLLERQSKLTDLINLCKDQDDLKELYYIEKELNDRNLKLLRDWIISDTIDY